MSGGPGYKLKGPEDLFSFHMQLQRVVSLVCMFLLCPTTGVEQVFRPAAKLTNPPASAAAVHRARMRHTLKGYKTLLPRRHAACVSNGAPLGRTFWYRARCLTAEIERLYNQICCRRQVAQLVFCPVFPSPFGGVAQVVRATVS